MRLLLLLPALVVAVPALAAPAWKRLGAEEATSTSYLQSNWNKYDENYHPNYVLDGNPKTAWVEGVAGDGEGEVITIPLSDLKSARAVKLVIFNGYQKSDKLLTANAAPKDVVIKVVDGSGDGVATQTATLERKMGPQEIVVNLPANRGVAGVSLQIKSVHKGSAYKDTCISDIEVHVDSDVPYNEKVEKQKLSAAAAWIKKRVDTAKAFAARPKTYPFASTHFDGKGEGKDEDVVDWDKNAERIAGRVTLGEQIDSGKATGIVKGVFSDAELSAFNALGIGNQPWYRLDSKGSAPVPDGLELLGDHVPLDVLAALAGPGATFFEATQAVTSLSPPDEPWRALKRSRFQVRFDDADKKIARKVRFEETEEVNERESYTNERTVLLTFDAKGQLESVLTRMTSGQSLGVASFSFVRDAEGRISSVTMKTASGDQHSGGQTANATWTATYAAVKPGA